MTGLEAIILGVLQGITEFLPISSTGHLILARAVVGADGAYALAFDAVLHLATAAAVIVYFRRDIVGLFHTAGRIMGKLPVDTRDRNLLVALLIGTIPAALLGMLLESQIETAFRSPLLVACVLVIGSILFAFAEWRYLTTDREPTLTPRKGLTIGFFQALALIPGMSRSGATIVGGMLLGLTRDEAARFAFLLAIPVILGAGTLKLIEILGHPEAVSLSVLIVGAVASFVTGIAAIHFMLGFVRKYSLWPFIWYRIMLAGGVVLLVFAG